MQEDNIISALIGLIGACETNPKTPKTDSLIIKALAFPLIESNSHPEKYSYQNTSLFQEIVEDIHKEKNAVAPNCALCTSPCGNTSDYDMQRIYQAEETIRKIKLEILSELQKLAFQLYNNPTPNLESEPEIPFFYRALSLIGCDREESILLETLKEAQQLRAKNHKKVE